MKYNITPCQKAYMDAHQISNDPIMELDVERVSHFAEIWRRQKPEAPEEEIEAHAIGNAAAEAYGIPKSAEQDAAREFLDSQRVVKVFEATRYIHGEQLPELIGEAKKIEPALSSLTTAVINTEVAVQLVASVIRAEGAEFDIFLVQQISEFTQTARKCAKWVIGWGIAVLILLSVITVRCHAQIDVVKLQEAGVTKATYAAPFTINFTSGCTLTKSGAIMGVACAGGSGSPGGANTSLQFNNGGAFGGFGLWDGTTLDLSLFRVKAAEYDSDQLNIANNGTIRLNKSDFIAWRNNANSANVQLGIDASDRIAATTFAGALVGNSSTATALAADPSDCAANQFANAIAASGNLTCAALTLVGAQFANQGTTTTVLHGNAAGNPSFAAVSISADVSGLGAGIATFLGAAPGTMGTVLVSNGTAVAPTFQAVNYAAGIKLVPIVPTTNTSWSIVGDALTEIGGSACNNNSATSTDGYQCGYITGATINTARGIAETNLTAWMANVATPRQLSFYTRSKLSSAAEIQNFKGFTDQTAATMLAAAAANDNPAGNWVGIIACNTAGAGTAQCSGNGSNSLFVCAMKDATTATYLSSGISTDTSTHSFQITEDSSGTWHFYIDGTEYCGAISQTHKPVSNTLVRWMNGLQNLIGSTKTLFIEGNQMSGVK